jgi:hypothetical protein
MVGLFFYITITLIKRIVSAILWLLPLLPTLIVPIWSLIYLLYSPIFSIGVILSFFEGSLSIII